MCQDFNNVDPHSILGGLAAAMICIGVVLVVITLSDYISWRKQRTKGRHFDLSD